VTSTPTTPGAEPDGATRRGPEDAAPDLHAGQPRPGSEPGGAEPPGGELPRAEVPAAGTSEALRPVQGLHVPDIGEDGRAVPGRYRTEGASGAREGTDEIRGDTDD
jgi:hypothetical protein